MMHFKFQSRQQTNSVGVFVCTCPWLDCARLVGYADAASMIPAINTENELTIQ